MTVAFMCANSAARALALIEVETETLATEEIPCGGQVDVAEILRAVADGATRVLVVVCHDGVCRSMLGNRYAAKNVEEARALLDEVACAVPVELHHVAANEPGRLRSVLGVPPATGGEGAG